MRTRSRWKPVLVVASAVVIGVAGVVGALTLLLYAFNPLANEHECEQGFAPATNRVGGVACFEEGEPLPQRGGWTWDPGGNQPIG